MLLGQVAPSHHVVWVIRNILHGRTTRKILPIGALIHDEFTARKHTYETLAIHLLWYLHAAHIVWTLLLEVRDHGQLLLGLFEPLEVQVNGVRRAEARRRRLVEASVPYAVVI